MPLSKDEFVKRWKLNTLTERQGSQPHFIDLCDMLGQPHPAAADSIGERFAFDKPVSKVYGGKGFADVWRRDHFAWEYKGKHKDLRAAYKQLNDYREELGNPPLLVVCDMDRFEVHTNFTNTQKRVYAFNLDDLARNLPTASCPLPPLEVLRALFGDTSALRPNRTDARVTQEAAKVFARLAERLEIANRSLTDTPVHTREEIAHFLMRLLFCLFADSIGLLPNHLFRNLIQSDDRFLPKKFLRKLKNLFEAMSQPDGIFGEHTIKYFNGGLFDSSSIIELDTADLAILHDVSRNYNWAHIAPEIFGTLFERSLNQERRSLIGAHYTSADDILLLIEPVLMQPLQRRWAEVKANILAVLQPSSQIGPGFAPHSEVEIGPGFSPDNTKAKKQGALAPGTPSPKPTLARPRSLLASNPKAEALLAAWIDELTSIRVLDPACGSGNFLYLALRRMLDLWKEATDFAVQQGISLVLPRMVSPTQLYGIETEFYAHELASIVVWIGFLQWKHENGVHDDREPILQKLDTIQHADAILRYDAQGKPYQPDWPAADFIIGNPPFLGGKKLRRELGDHYVDDLFAVHGQSVAAESDLVVYWFEKSRAVLTGCPHLRVGLLATQQIRKGFNQRVLKRIKETGDIFWAFSDKGWFAEVKKEEGKGKRERKERRKIAAIRVAMVGFDNALESFKQLDGRPVEHINPDLTDGIDVTAARVLAENRHMCYQGPIRVGRFDVKAADVQKLLKSPLNVNGRPNSDVVRRYVRTTDLTGRPRDVYIID